MRGFGLAQLLSQARGVLLQGEQGALALLVLADALVQLLVLPGQPGVALGRVLIKQLRCQRMRFEAWRQGLLLRGQLFLLLQQFFLLRDHAADFGAQFGELFLELIDHPLGVGLFAFIMTTEALQQCFGLMIRVLVAAADRARLIVLQLRAQLLDTGTARQTLALKQLAGDVEGLLGDGQLGFAFHPVLSQLLALLLGAEQALLQFAAALVEVLLAGPQTRQIFEGAQLFAVVLQQRAEQADLFGDGIGLGAGLLEQHFELLLLCGQGISAASGAVFEAGQFCLTLVQAIADQHQLLQAIAVGVPGIAQRRQMGTLLQLAGDALQSFGGLGLLLLQSLNGLLAVGAGLLRREFGLGTLRDVLDQAGEGALFFKGLTQQRRVLALPLLRLAQGDFRGIEGLLQLRLALAQFGVLLRVRGDLHGQRREQCIEFGLAGELVPLRGQLLELAQLDPLTGQRLPLLLRAVQLLGGGLLRILQQAQILEPAVLLLKLFELRLLQLHLLLCGAAAFVQFGAGFRGERGDAAGLILQQLVRFAGLFGLVEGAATEARVQRGVGELFQQFAAVVVVGLEERAELALRQQYGAGELLEVQAQRGFELGFVFAFLAGEQLILIDVAQTLPTGLQLAAGLLASTVGFPARAITSTVDTDKIHLGIAFAGAATQQRTRVAGGDFAVGVRDFGVAASVVEARHRTEQRQAQGIEQRAFAGAGRAGDREQASAGQRFGGEIDFERAGQRGQVLQANGENLHGCSPSICTSCSSSAKSLRVCSSTSLP